MNQLYNRLGILIACMWLQNTICSNLQKNNDWFVIGGFYQNSRFDQKPHSQIPSCARLNPTQPNGCGQETQACSWSQIPIISEDGQLYVWIFSPLTSIWMQDHLWHAKCASISKPRTAAHWPNLWSPSFTCLVATKSLSPAHLDESAIFTSMQPGLS